MAVVDRSALKVKAGDDAADAGWFTIVKTQEEADVFSLLLTGKNETLTARVKRISGGKDGPYLILENHGLAFDHAKILAFAMSVWKNKNFAVDFYKVILFWGQN